MIIMNNNDYLKHFGVKDMRWGVRRRSEQSGASSNRKKIGGLYKSYSNYKIRQNAKLKNRTANLSNKQVVGLGIATGTIAGVGQAIAERNLKNTISYAAIGSIVSTGSLAMARDIERKTRAMEVSEIIKKNLN